MADILETISNWAADLTWDDVPDGAKSRAADALRDTVATTVGGAPTGAAAIAIAYALRSPGATPVVSTGQTASSTAAAFANAVAASTLDFDDGHYLAGAIHPGSVVIPGMLAAVTDSTTVQQALLAQVAGYEIGLRAASRLWPKHENDHYHCTGCAGAIGAAVAAAKLMGLDADGIARAIMISWVHAPMSTFGQPMVKESIGWGAATGISAAELAAAGFMKLPAGYSIPENDVLRPTPFHEPGAAEDPFISSIGSRFETEHTYFKSFAACRYTHAAGAGFQQLMRDNGIAVDDIQSVRVGTHKAATFLNELNPQTIETAQYSFPIVFGSLALWGQVGAPEMSEERLNDPERLAFASKVRLEYDADLDQYYPQRYPSRVDITTAAGTVSGVFLDAPGDPGTSFGPAELRAKWERLLEAELGAANATSILDGIGNPSANLGTVLAPMWAKF